MWTHSLNWEKKRKRCKEKEKKRKKEKKRQIANVYSGNFGKKNLLKKIKSSHYSFSVSNACKNHSVFRAELSSSCWGNQCSKQISWCEIPSRETRFDKNIMQCLIFQSLLQIHSSRSVLYLPSSGNSSMKPDSQRGQM